MLTLFSCPQGIGEKLIVTPGTTSLPPAVWFDLLEPTREEFRAVETALGIELPSREEMQEIELSSRLYEERGALFMTASLVAKIDTDRPETHAVTFVVTPTALVTVRYTDPLPFITFAARALKSPYSCATADGTFVGLLEAIVDRIADVLERTSATIEQVSRGVFGQDQKTKRQGKALQDALEGIGRGGTLVSEISESLMSLSRAVAFFSATAESWLHKETKTHVKTLTRDIRSLHEHAAFLNSKTNFLLDATLGMINIEQNTIIKIFSVAAVAFLPPTLIASIYGMNFANQPELHWEYGYPMALCLMVLSAVLPFFYFRRKGWL